MKKFNCPVCNYANLNGKNDEYIVLFGNDRFNPDLHYVTCKHRYTSIKEAREYASSFLNAYIFKLHWKKGDDTPYYIRKMV